MKLTREMYVLMDLKTRGFYKCNHVFLTYQLQITQISMNLMQMCDALKFE